MKVGIIVGSIREGRAGAQVGEWVLETAQAHGGAEFELVELQEFNVPLFTSATHPAAANRNYDDANVQAWGDKVNEFDAFIFVTAEYNHGVPGAFKNAFDTIAPEWMNKRVAFVGYGAANGTRAIEQWRTIVANMNMWDIRSTVELNLFTEFNESGFAPDPRRNDDLNALLDQLVA